MLSEDSEEKLLLVTLMLTLWEDIEESKDRLESDEREEKLLFETEKLTSEIWLEGSEIEEDELLVIEIEIL